MLVSCVMPTCDRRNFIHAAIDCFQKQTYEHRELIVMDDGENKVKDLIPADPKIRYIELSSRMILGAKRNAINEEAKGDVIIHFDDDDWSAPNRVADGLKLLAASGKPLVGYKNMLYWDVTEQKAKKYIGWISNYIVGLSLCYLKSYWKEYCFKVQQISSDGGFILGAVHRREPLAFASMESHYIVSRIHSQNVSDKSGLKHVVPNEILPKEFWDNEALRIGRI